MLVLEQFGFVHGDEDPIGLSQCLPKPSSASRHKYDDRRYLTRRILREIQHACDRASAYLLAREEVVRGSYLSRELRTQHEFASDSRKR